MFLLVLGLVLPCFILLPTSHLFVMAQVTMKDTYDKSYAVPFSSSSSSSTTLSRLVSHRLQHHSNEVYDVEDEKYRDSSSISILRAEEAISWSRQYRTSYPLIEPCGFTLENIRSCNLNVDASHSTCYDYANSIAEISNTTCLVNVTLTYALTNVGSSTKIQSISASIDNSKPRDTLTDFNSSKGGDWIITGDVILVHHTRIVNICDLFTRPIDVQVQVYCSNHAVSPVQNDSLPIVSSNNTPKCDITFDLSCTSRSSGGDCIRSGADNILLWKISNGFDSAVFVDEVTIFVAHDIPIHFPLNSTVLKKNQTMIGSTSKYSSMFVGGIVAVLEYRTLPVHNRISCTVQATWEPTPMNNLTTSIPTQLSISLRPTSSHTKSIKEKGYKNHFCKKKQSKSKKLSSHKKAMISRPKTPWTCPSPKSAKSKSKIPTVSFSSKPSIGGSHMNGSISSSPSKSNRLNPFKKHYAKSKKSSPQRKPTATSSLVPKGMKSQSPSKVRRPKPFQSSSIKSKNSIKYQSKTPAFSLSSLKGMSLKRPTTKKSSSVKSKPKVPTSSSFTPSTFGSPMIDITSHSPSVLKTTSSIKSSSKKSEMSKPAKHIKPSHLSPSGSSFTGMISESPSVWRPRASFKSSSVKSVKSSPSRPRSSPMPSPSGSLSKGKMSELPSVDGNGRPKKSSSKKSVKSKSIILISSPAPSPSYSSMKGIMPRSPYVWRPQTPFKRPSLKYSKAERPIPIISSIMPYPKVSSKGIKPQPLEEVSRPTSTLSSSVKSKSTMQITPPVPLVDKRWSRYPASFKSSKSLIQGTTKGHDGKSSIQKLHPLRLKSKKVTVNSSSLSRSPSGYKYESTKLKILKSLNGEKDGSYKKLKLKKTKGYMN